MHETSPGHVQSQQHYFAHWQVLPVLVVVLAPENDNYNGLTQFKNHFGRDSLTSCNRISANILQ